MATTPRYGLHHPVRTDPFAPHDDLTALAEDVETALVSVEALGLPAEPWADIPPLVLWDDDTGTGISIDTPTSLCRWRSHHAIAQLNARITFTAALPTGTGFTRLRLVPPGGLVWNGFTLAAAYRLAAADGSLTPISCAPTTFEAKANGLAVPNVPFLAGDILLLSAEFEPVSGAASAAEAEMLTALEAVTTEEAAGE